MRGSACLRLLAATTMAMGLQSIPWSGHAHAAAEEAAAHAPRPDLNGLRVKSPASSRVYLIDKGQRRWIPNPQTYQNLFRDWNGIISDINVADIDPGPDLSPDTVLAQAAGDPKVYLIDLGSRRWITSPDAFNQYYFNWSKIHTVPPATLNAIPTGSSISASPTTRRGVKTPA